MSKTLIDLSVAIENDVPADPPPLRPQISYLDHAEGAAEMEQMFGIPADKLRDQAGPASERVAMTTHNGTHLDAPWHYHPTMDGGTHAMTIDEVPLEWCMGRGVKLDFRALPDGYVVTEQDVQAELDRIGHTLAAGDIVLVNTAAGARYGHDDYVATGCGMGREATLFLARNGVKVCGTDAWSWDAPLASQVENIKKTGDYSLFWEGHKAGADCVYCHIEKLTNLDQLPDTGFEVMAFPVKVSKASAGWCRAVAVIHD